MTRFTATVSVSASRPSSARKSSKLEQYDYSSFNTFYFSQSQAGNPQIIQRGFLGFFYETMQRIMALSFHGENNPGNAVMAGWSEFPTILVPACEPMAYPTASRIVPSSHLHRWHVSRHDRDLSHSRTGSLPRRYERKITFR